MPNLCKSPNSGCNSVSSFSSGCGHKRRRQLRARARFHHVSRGRAEVARRTNLGLRVLRHVGGKSNEMAEPSWLKVFERNVEADF